MKHLLALCGPRGCGKSTIARLLDFYNGFTISPFAEPIKEMMRTLLSIQGATKEEIDEMLYGRWKETPTPYLCGQTPRHAMQTLGTEWRNMIDRNLWLDVWTKKIGRYDKRIVVDDLRFLHEAERVKSLGGNIIMISRPGFGPDHNHPSESEYLQIPYDFVVNNDADDPKKSLRLIQAAFKLPELLS